MGLLILRCGFTLAEALDEFEASRGVPLERGYLLEGLKRLFPDKCAGMEDTRGEACMDMSPLEKMEEAKTREIERQMREEEATRRKRYAAARYIAALEEERKKAVAAAAEAAAVAAAQSIKDEDTGTTKTEPPDSDEGNWKGEEGDNEADVEEKTYLEMPEETCEYEETSTIHPNPSYEYEDTIEPPVKTNQTYSINPHESSSSSFY
eukprot:Platyproteum_vivax@DN4980_c0_g1_i1.p2